MGYGALIGVLAFSGLVIMLFLVLQVQNNYVVVCENHALSQKELEESAKSLISSATQMHPFLKLEDVYRSKMLFDNVVNRYGGNVATVESTLKLDKGSLLSLRDKIQTQYDDISDFLMTQFLEVEPKLDVELNAQARLTKRSRKQRAQS